MKEAVYTTRERGNFIELIFGPVNLYRSVKVRRMNVSYTNYLFKASDRNKNERISSDDNTRKMVLFEFEYDGSFIHMNMIILVGFVSFRYIYI